MNNVARRRCGPVLVIEIWHQEVLMYVGVIRALRKGSHLTVLDRLVDKVYLGTEIQIPQVLGVIATSKVSHEIIIDVPLACLLCEIKLGIGILGKGSINVVGLRVVVSKIGLSRLSRGRMLKVQAKRQMIIISTEVDPKRPRPRNC